MNAPPETAGLADASQYSAVARERSPRTAIALLLSLRILCNRRAKAGKGSQEIKELLIMSFPLGRLFQAWMWLPDRAE